MGLIAWALIALTLFTSSPDPTEVHAVSRGMVERGHYMTMEVTAYCPCVVCCGKDDGITKSGVKAVAGVTVAADLPLGTKVCIEGHWYTVQDTGGDIKGNRIDVYFDTHEEALQWGPEEEYGGVSEMSWEDDYDFGFDWERRMFGLKSGWQGRDTVWVGIHQNYKVRDMEEFHIHNCLKMEGLHPRWYELFEEELKIRAKEAFND